MPEKKEKLLEQLNTYSKDRRSLRQIVTSLSLVVIVIVFWSLKLTGIGIAGEAFCGKSEHSHSDECLTKELICTLEEIEAHQHSESCILKTLICQQEEILAHQHNDSCIAKTLICQLEENAEHAHIDTCWSVGIGFGCGLLEADGHIHTAACLTEETELSCNQETTEGHAHTDACWTLGKGFECGLLEADGHTHTAECLTEETELGCNKEATLGHTHTDECYKQLDVCPLEEHVHDETCYSNINADLETSDDWEQTLADIARGPTTKENVVLVAQSQLGYIESTLNFQVDANGVRRGITRYGQWYGNPYGDWTSMFVSFCLYYAGAEDLPANAGPEAMRLEWESAGLYKAVTETAPEIGHLIFLHKGEREYSGANAVAIIIGFDENTVTVIEGDLGNTVAETQYALDDGAIMGYGLTPEADAIIALDEPAVIAEDCTVWLDGTDGGLSFLTGSPNTAYTTQVGSTIQLPDTWTSPSKYSYKLQGWYDITNNQYYPAGGEMEVTGNAVLYADWVASSYDIGVFNAQVADTVSTNEFITTHLFDYNSLFNILSSEAQITVDASSHSETWSTVNSGNVGYMDRETLNFVFIDGAPNYRSGNLAYSNNRQTHNTYPGSGIVTSGIYNTARYHALFDTEDSLGKKYLGTGDHLFQIMTDPNDEYYGYYYYDSQRNAASYNQNLGRFYVYEYLSAPSDSVGSTNSGFLPLNSPYANTNGNNIATYTYNGTNGEYAGVNHFQYASGYSSSDQVLANFAYGMRSDVRFYLPDDTGTDGNKDIYGNDMHFHFSGDDDVWVLIDGELVLDIGGIHGVESGDINFVTGEISVQDSVVGTVAISAGEHVMSVLYLERGASSSNCAIYFNLAPRYSLDIQKEDVLTQQLLDGAQFSVYTDVACTVPAELYTSEAAYEQGDASTNTFTVTNGIAHMWGLSPSKTYYIKETGPPSAEGYSIPQGTIQITIDKYGQATYHVEVVDDPSPGFTVHGVSIDEQSQRVYIVVTNAPDTVTDITTVQVIKKWEDAVDHSSDYIQAYLTVTDPDGTVRRIREVTLSDENGWMYTWTNLPKYDYDTLTEVQYGIEESYESGYYSTVRKITQIEISRTEWAEAASFVNGESYILGHSNGYLSTASASDAALCWVEEATAKESALATWTATVSGGKVKFTNGAGQTLTFVYSSRSSSRYFYATTATSGVQTFTPVDAGTGFRFYATRNNSSSGTKYYMASSGINSNGRISTTTGSSGGLILTPMKKITQTDIQQVEDWAYQITNTPLAIDNETSMTVSKNWVTPEGYNSALYQEYAVTVRLFANGINTGRTITLNLKNNWQGVFQGLPYQDDNGNVIRYTVDEVWEKAKWSTTYGEVQSDGGAPPNYSVTITNTYHPGGPELPSTGSAARLMYVLCGSAIMLGTLAYGIGSRRKRERRMK